MKVNNYVGVVLAGTLLLPGSAAILAGQGRRSTTGKTEKRTQEGACPIQQAGVRRADVQRLLKRLAVHRL
jgi:hypothetical protein